MSDLLTEAGATFSTCGAYRTKLWRIWDQGALPMLMLLLNPSTADAATNDPTVERGCRRARSLGYGGLMVANAYSLRSTDPRALYEAHDPIGPDNDEAIARGAALAGLVVCGWGEHCDRVRPGRSGELLALIRSAGKVPHCLAINASGAPKHPLYVSYAAQPRLFGVAA